MSLVNRVKNIILTPKTEWPVIAAEPATAPGLLAGYVAPLAAIGVIAGFIGTVFIGVSLPFLGTYRYSVMGGLSTAVLTFVMAFVGVLIVAAITNVLAPSFGGQKNFVNALKVTVYAYTPGWVAGILNLLPALSLLVVLAMLYGIYLFYVGLPHLMKNPPEKSVGYTAVVVIVAIVVSIVVSMVIGALTLAFGVGPGAGLRGGGLGGGLGAATRGGDVTIDKNSPLGKLEEFGKRMEEVNKKMEAAQKSGDQQAAAKAGADVLGAVLGGGKSVDPLGVDQIKVFVPETLAGLPRKSNRTEKSGFASIMVTKAEATYADDANAKSVNLVITDTGGVSGMMMFAGWAGIQGEKEDENSREVTRKDGGRLVHEKVSKKGGSNEFGIVLGERFVVSASGRGVSLEELKGAVSSLDLGKLEALKDAGVQK